MSNTYFVTLSYQDPDPTVYTEHIGRIENDKKNTKLLYCRQYGTTNHLHYHLLIETDTSTVQKFRMRFRTYMKPLKLTSINLDIKHTDKPGVYLNYFKRDPSSEIINTLSKPFDMAKLKEEALATPDPGPNRPALPWNQVYSKLVAAGYKYPERPGKYIRILEKHFNIDHIVTNPKKLNLWLRYYGSKEAQDWDDVYNHNNNQNQGF